MGEIDDAFARLAEVIRARGPVPEEVVLGLELFRSTVTRWLSNSTGSLFAPEHGRWIVTPFGTQVDLTRRPTLMRLLQALVEVRVDRPGEAVPSSALIARGWPEDPVVSEASANRLRVALCRLRQLGLESVIMTTNAGWMLNTAVPVVRDESVMLEGIDSTPPERPEAVTLHKSGIFGTYNEATGTTTPTITAASPSEPAPASEESTRVAV
jgi:hypothetical protein